MIALLWRLPRILVRALWRLLCFLCFLLAPLLRLCLPLLCFLLLSVPVGGLALWVQVQQAGYVDVCLPALLGGACVFVMPGDVDVTWG